MTFEAQHYVYTKYLLMKVYQRDWHGVSDAANDLRELEKGEFMAKKKVMKKKIAAKKKPMKKGK